MSHGGLRYHFFIQSELLGKKDHLPKIKVLIQNKNYIRLEEVVDDELFTHLCKFFDKTFDDV